MAVLKSLLSLLIVTLSLSPLCFQHASAADFDFFTLALSRSATVCMQAFCCASTAPPEFSIRGFWPDYDNGSWPECCEGPDINYNQILPQIQSIQRFWPALICEHYYTSCNGLIEPLLWVSEWNKHGKCASPVLRDAPSYFGKAIDLYRRYDVDKILTEAGIVGSDTAIYALKDIVSAIEKSIGAPPTVICENDYLKEVRLCFENDFIFTPRSCGTVTSKNCSENIIVPTVESSVNGGWNAANKKAFNPITLNVA